MQIRPKGISIDEGENLKSNILKETENRNLIKN